jgi:hypothetical protein
MKKMILSAKPIILILAVSVLSFAGAIGLRIAIAAWTGPSAPPPGSNVEAPINVGSDAQTKQGSLTIQQGSSLYVGATGRFYNDGTYMRYNGPTSFYVTGNVNRAYIYPSDIYLGPSGGSNVYFRGSTLTGNEWSLNATGNLDVDCVTLGTSGQKCDWADVGSSLPSGSSGQTLRHDGSDWVANSVIYNNGTNVGIGTASPGDKLVISGGDIDVRADTPRVRATDTGESNKYIELRYESGWGRLYTDGSNIYTNRMFRADGGLRVGDDEGFYRNAEDVVRTGDSLIVDGNIGIGDTSPDSKLDVDGGDIRISTAGKGLIFPDGTKQTTAATGVDLHGWSFANDYLYDDGEEVIRANDEWLRLNQAGNFSNGVYTPGLIRADGGVQVDGITAIDSANRYHYSKYNTATNRFGAVNTSGFGIDATNNGDWDILAYEGNVYLQYSNTNGKVYIGGQLLDYNDDTVNIGENMDVNGNLDVAGDIETTGVNVAANTRSSHFNTDGTFYRYSGQVYITVDDNLYIRDTDGSTKIHFNTNQGKLTIDLIDPLYNINGEKFATYMAAMTGVKEETTGKVDLTCQDSQCVKIIDFDDVEKGSDLWLFYQVTDFGKNWDNLVVLLTPESKNNVWYEVNSDKNQLLIYGENEGRVSYRLTAPRFDHQKWPNVSTEEELEGMKVELKNK